MLLHFIEEKADPKDPNFNKVYMRTHSLSSRHNPISFVLRLTSWCVLAYVIRKNFNVSMALKILTYNASGLLISKFAL